MGQLITYNGNIEKIIEQGEKLDLQERRKYYEDVIDELYVKQGAFKRDLYVANNSVRQRLKKEIKQIESNLDMQNRTSSIVKIKSRYGTSDIVRIFECMMKAGIINYDTEVKNIANIFFTESEEKQKFTDNYYSRRKEVESLHRSSNSKELIKFAKNLIESCFAKKEDVLDELSEHIADLRKKT